MPRELTTAYRLGYKQALSLSGFGSGLRTAANTVGSRVSSAAGAAGETAVRAGDKVLGQPLDWVANSRLGQHLSKHKGLYFGALPVAGFVAKDLLPKRKPKPKPKSFLDKLKEFSPLSSSGLFAKSGSVDKQAGIALDALLSGVGGYYASKSDFMKNHADQIAKISPYVLLAGAGSRLAGNVMWDSSFTRKHMNEEARAKLRRRAKLVHALGSLGVLGGGSGWLGSKFVKHKGAVEKIEDGIGSFGSGVSRVGNVLSKLKKHGKDL